MQDARADAQQLAGTVIAEDFEGWSEDLRDEFIRNAHNEQVGSRLDFEDDRVRVWHIEVLPGERLPVHRHVRDYFWTAITPGASIQHTEDGLTRRVSYRAGDTRSFAFPGEQYLLHDLENVGDTTLMFTTVEFLS